MTILNCMPNIFKMCKRRTKINMICNSCGKEIGSDEKYCKYCGAEVKNIAIASKNNENHDMPFEGTKSTYGIKRKAIVLIIAIALISFAIALLKGKVFKQTDETKNSAEMNIVNILQMDGEVYFSETPRDCEGKYITIEYDNEENQIAYKAEQFRMMVYGNNDVEVGIYEMADGGMIQVYSNPRMKYLYQYGDNEVLEWNILEEGDSIIKTGYSYYNGGMNANVYNEEGNILKSEQYDYTYDENGNVISYLCTVTSFSDQDKSSETNVGEIMYDEDNRNVLTSIYDNENNLIKQVEFEYDESGRIKSLLHTKYLDGCLQEEILMEIETEDL